MYMHTVSVRYVVNMNNQDAFCDKYIYMVKKQLYYISLFL